MPLPRRYTIPVSDRRWIRDLTEAERLVIWSIRRWASGREHWPLVWREHGKLLGAYHGHATLAALVRYLGAICKDAGRTVGHHAACCPCVGRDEALMLSLAAAAHAGHHGLATAHAATLLSPDGMILADRTRAAIAAGAALAAAMEAAGWPLAYRGDWRVRDIAPAGNRDAAPSISADPPVHTVPRFPRA
ncbi:hypothetical protein [Futiania mangrovi]|uniref:Uncharacterized protein n=1 Tax=Futiania mangrovi TaxID=2959716 RepID=A0A9J6PCE7_9PROT|nr:hypothetical protein [Futiania mangrovii]MCP1335934.1 hypothetical protein [Futiania mangrovii]